VIVLESIATGEQLQSWPSLPAKFKVGTISVHAPCEDWHNDDYRLVVYPDATPVKDIEDVRNEALLEIDSEFNRQLSIEPGVQEARRLKLEEAEEILENGPEGDFPMVAASSLDGESLEDAAARIYSEFKQGETKIATMEKSRIAAKRAVRDAETSEHINQVLASLSWSAK